MLRLHNSFSAMRVFPSLRSTRPTFAGPSSRFFSSTLSGLAKHEIHLGRIQIGSATGLSKVGPSVPPSVRPSSTSADVLTHVGPSTFQEQYEITQRQVEQQPEDPVLDPKEVVLDTQRVDILIVRPRRRGHRTRSDLSRSLRPSFPGSRNGPSTDRATSLSSPKAP